MGKTPIRPEVKRSTNAATRQGSLPAHPKNRTTKCVVLAPWPQPKCRRAKAWAGRNSSISSNPDRALAPDARPAGPVPGWPKMHLYGAG